MKVFVSCLIMGMLFGLTPHSVFAQHNQTPQQQAQEIENLKKRVSALEKQLQTVENVEKLDLQAKLAEANAKLTDAKVNLVNTEFEKFQRALRIDNLERMERWSLWFFGILAFIAAISGAAIWFFLKSLISDGVEKNLNGFKEGLAEVVTLKNEIGVLKNQQMVLEREHTTATLEDFLYDSLWYEQNHPEQIKGLAEEALLEVFGDKGRIETIRYKAVEVLVARRSRQSVPPIFELLNSVVDSDAEFDFETENNLRGFINFLGHLHTPDAYQGLKRFLNRLLTENPKHKDTFLMETVLAFGNAGIELDMRDSVSILKSAMTHFQHPASDDLSALVVFFDRFKDSAGIKEILTKHVTSGMPEVREQCLTALEKCDSEFVEKWRTQNRTENADSS